MAYQGIRCGILGAQDQDLAILSTLHNRENVQIAFVYDRDPNAVGMEIAEILGVPRFGSPDDLRGLDRLDFVVVSEPRRRFTPELEVLSTTGAALINPTEALKRFASPEKPAPQPGSPKSQDHTIEDSLSAIEKLLDRNELLRFLLDVAVESAGATAGSIMLYSPETDDLYIGYAIGLSERVVKRTRQRVGLGIAGEVAQSREPRLIRSMSGQTIYDEDRERMDIGSAISVPLLWSNQLLGVLNVSVDRAGQPLDEGNL
ncbi:MAG: GAF domain-containing protein, partial [Candidatus Latescibacterota bacterium]